MKYLVLIALLYTTGCAQLFSAREDGPVLIEKARGGTPREIEIRNVTFGAQEIKAAAAHPATSRVRLVETTKPGGQSDFPEYRMFDVLDKSAPFVIGVRNADVLVASHGYVVFSPKQFGNYLHTLSTLKEGSIEIRRDGKPILFKISIIP